MDTPKILTIHELTLYLKGLLQKDRRLQNIWLRGEISNFKLHTPSGHMYFTLKDEYSCIKAVMFRSKAQAVPFRPESGMKIVVRGFIDLYERDGQYQLYAEEMQPDGIGALYLALEQLKAKLANEGLFNPQRKKKLPVLPRCIGVATSLTGAAVHDILKVTFRRFPNMRVVIAPCAVQGENAPGEIAKAIRMLNMIDDLDVIITGRGGGSKEELWAFNSEEVVRAIAESEIPVISAVGHETDTSLADLAADLRAPTPSAAAELAVPAKSDLYLEVQNLKERLSLAVQSNLKHKKQISDLLASSSVLCYPQMRIEQEKQYIDQLYLRLQQNATGFIEQKSVILKLLSGKLDMLSPLKVLARGYAICQTTDSKNLITEAAQVRTGDDLVITLSRGELYCSVKGTGTCLTKQR